MFIIGKILAAILFPPGLFVLLAVVLVFCIYGKHKKTAYAIAGSIVLIAYVLSTCAFSNLLVLPLENKYAPLANAEEASAIVVLGGGYNDSSPEYQNRGSLLPVAEKRAIYGLELARNYGLPLIFSGGKGYDSRAEGSEASAAERLWLSLGFDKKRITIETGSLDTKGNAAGVEKLVRGRKVLLVTSAFHMPRAMLSFEKAGISAIPAPTDYRAKRSAITWADFLPDASWLEISALALHEYFGILYYRLTL
jgi:uncharacterized SAM-binding protein YcdF (DUF218 family)